MSDIGTSITVSFLALGVIFLTLSLLIGIIKVLVVWMPYVEPSPQARQSPSAGDTEEHIAIIHTAISYYLGKRPEEIQMGNIHPL